jgi:hypothetical protein
MKQIKLIDKSKKEDLNSEPNKELLNDLERLQLYAKNVLKISEEINNNDIEEINNNSLNQSNIDDAQSLSQAEVESLMPSVIIFIYIYFTTIIL